MKSVSDAAKIANMVMTGAGERKKFLKKDSFESSMKPRFLADRLGTMGLVVWREREELTILEVLLRETDKTDFNFRGIENEIVRRHPR